MIRKRRSNVYLLDQIQNRGECFDLVWCDLYTANDEVKMAAIMRWPSAVEHIDNPTEKEKALHNIKWEL